MHTVGAIRYRSSPLRSSSGVFLLLVALSLSYWYCLPVASSGLLGYNETRGYDLLHPLLALALLSWHYPALRQCIARDRAAFWLFRFCVWASFMCIVTVVFYLSMGRPVAVVASKMTYVLRLWGFFFAYAGFKLFANTRERCFLLLDLFIIIGTVEAVAICLQGSGVLPSFWSERYSGYGERVYCGTLGANRTSPGHAMVVFFCVSFTYLSNPRTIGIKRNLLAVAGCLTALPALAVIGSRTAWLVFGVFCAALLLRRRNPLPSLLLLAAMGVAVILASPDALKEKTAEMYDWKITGRLQHVEGGDLVEKFDAIDAGRTVLWQGGVQMLLAKPWAIPFGVGFANYQALDPKAISAHNMYITLVGELGLVGLFLYLMWFGSLFRNNPIPANTSPRKMFIAAGYQPLLIAFAVSLFAGEILYVYRTAFAALGMFLFISAVLNHPALAYARLRRRPAFRPATSVGVAQGGTGVELGVPTRLQVASARPHLRRPSWLSR